MARIKIYYILFLQSLLLHDICHATVTDVLCLKTLRASVNDPNNFLNWKFDNTSEGSICKFTGVECWHQNENRVLNLRLSNMGLVGTFPRGIENCSSLTGLDLSSNNFTGPIPSNIFNIIPFVTSLDLSYNNFSGEIPVNLSQCSYLNTLNLQYNKLSGEIPWQLIHLTRLTQLNVASNLLSGLVPAFSSSVKTSYVNNLGLCGGSLGDCPGSWKGHMSVIIGSAIAGVVIVAILVGFVLFFCLRKVPSKKMKKELEENRWTKNIKSAKGVKVCRLVYFLSYLFVHTPPPGPPWSAQAPIMKSSEGSGQFFF
jgi:Leucine rich repeat N-terminal domain/Leucine Rich repeat